jgi:hypothetical protein
MIIDELFEAPQQCPECGGISFSNLILAEKKDACYHKVKASAKVWPSAYASGRLVQCRKKGAANYGNKSEGVAEAGFPGAPDVEMPPMNPSGDPQRDKLKQEYMDLHREIKSLVDLQYRSTSDEQKMQAKARIEQLNDRADQIKAILEPRQPPNEWQKKTYGFDDNWNKVKQGMAENANLNYIWIQGDFDGDTASSGATQGSWRDQQSTPVKLTRGRMTNVRPLSGPPPEGGKTIKQAQIPLTLDAGEQKFSTTGVDLQLTVAPNGYVTNGEVGRVRGTAVVKIMRPESVEEDLTRRGFLRGLGAAALAGAAGGALAGSNDPNFVRKVHDQHNAMIEKNPRYAKEHDALGIYLARGIAGASAENNKRWVEKTAKLLQKYGVNVNEGMAETRRGQIPMTLKPGETDNLEPEDFAGFKKLPAYQQGQTAQQKAGKQLIQKSPYTFQSDQDWAYRQGATDAQRAAMFANFGGTKPLTTAEGEQQKGADYRDPKEVDYDDEYDAMVARVKKLAGLGPMKTVYNPTKRQYRNMPTAVQPKK